MDELLEKFTSIPIYYIEIGVFVEGGKRKKDTGKSKKPIDVVKLGINNAELMYIHENGSPLNHIPKRPVLKMTIDYAKKYPQYGFEKHKGYVTKAHKEALSKYGPCPIHRKSFKPVQEVMKEQISLNLDI